MINTAHLVFWVCAALAAVIFGVMLWSVATFQGDQDSARRNSGAASYLHSRAVEFLWALIPIAIFFGAVAPVERMLAGDSAVRKQGISLTAALERGAAQLD
jgi:heme/copper-type cytochrome/quinol oxidase subunit 2